MTTTTDLAPTDDDSNPKPAPKPAAARLNMRMALAGTRLLEAPGCSMYEALRWAGYRHSTARKPTRNGLTAERCIAEARKLDPTVSGRALVAKARRVADRALSAALDAAPGDLQLQVVAKTLDTVEKWHGQGPEEAGKAATRDLAARAALLDRVLSEMRARGVLRGVENEDSRPQIEGRVVEVDPVEPVERAGVKAREGVAPRPRAASFINRPPADNFTENSGGLDWG